ncbi:MAG: hypothetical protein PHQ04_12185 [Opitutaceae bacterium]|nr:hypothetical protein [Opitutaceae bacterium]
MNITPPPSLCQSARALALTTLASLVLSATAFAGEAPGDSFVLQSARAGVIEKSMNTVNYSPDLFNLADLPRYVPERQVSGVVRLWGSDMFGGAGLRSDLTNGFRKYQPGVTVEFNLKTNMLAVSGLLHGTAQIGATHVLTWETLLAFQRLYNYDPLTIAPSTGWATMPPFAIMVNVANPLNSLTLKQLDGIYGAPRSGGWVGTTWHPEYARGPEGNIRTWGQLGLTGEWADKPINPYSYAIRCMFGFRFSNTVLQGSDKWSERVQECFNITQPDGTFMGMDPQLAENLAKDRYGIAYLSILRGKSPAIKALAIAPTDGAAPVSLTFQTVRDRTYPLTDSMYFFINRKPGTPLDPPVKEFLRFILSREGQEAFVRDGKMLPLTAEFIRQERQKLE